MHIKKTALLFFLFACIGITTEIFFTAITDTIKSAGTPDFSLRLKGQSYIWMFPIYGCISFLGPWVIDKIYAFPILLRALIYSTIILTFEFFAGWLLEKTTGTCPWKYTEGWHIYGFIRLDYSFAWMIFGLFVEQIYLFSSTLLNHLNHENKAS